MVAAQVREINLEDQAAIVRETATATILPSIDPMIDAEIDRLLEPENLTQVIRDRVVQRLGDRLANLFAPADSTPGTYHAEPLLDVTSELESAENSKENSAQEIELKLPRNLRRTITQSQIQKNLQLAIPKSKPEQIFYLEQITSKTEAGLAFLDRILDTVVAVFGGDRPSAKAYLNGARKLLTKLADEPAADPK